MDMELLRRLLRASAVKWSTHCLERMQERDISREDVRSVILHGELIEDYPDDYPFPSCLIFGHGIQGKILHVVAGTDGSSVYIITAYIPSGDKFEADMKTRKERS